MIGRCYLRGNNLEYSDADMHWQTLDQPCRWVTRPAGGSPGLQVGHQPCSFQTSVLVLFSHLGDVTSEVMCNMGISATITQTEVIVGSPGSFEWQGEAPPTTCHRGPSQSLTLCVLVCV